MVEQRCKSRLIAVVGHRLGQIGEVVFLIQVHLIYANFPIGGPVIFAHSNVI